MVVKEADIAINVNLSESWLRSYQVLLERTHPLVAGVTCLREYSYKSD